MNIGPDKKPMGLQVHSQTQTSKPDGFNFLPINRPAGQEIDPNPCPNKEKPHRISGCGTDGVRLPLAEITGNPRLEIRIGV